MCSRSKITSVETTTTSSGTWWRYWSCRSEKSQYTVSRSSFLTSSTSWGFSKMIKAWKLAILASNYPWVTSKRPLMWWFFNVRPSTLAGTHPSVTLVITSHPLSRISSTSKTRRRQRHKKVNHQLSAPAAPSKKSHSEVRQPRLWRPRPAFISCTVWLSASSLPSYKWSISTSWER